MNVDDFKILNASVKELIITDSPVNFEGSIRLAFPELVCFCAGSSVDEPTEETLPAILDLVLLSDRLKELVLYRPKGLPPMKEGNPLDIDKFIPSFRKTITLYPDFLSYYLNRSVSEDCALEFKIRIGPNIQKITVSGLSMWMEFEKKQFV